MTKIFGIGKGKTGSNSLAQALGMLGYSVHHTGKGVWENKTQVRDTLIENMNNDKPTLEGVEEFDAYMDYPIHMVWLKLRSEYPDAKFILTYRPPDDCALSWCRMVRTKRADPWTPHIISFSEYRDIVIDHNDQVLRTFKDDPNLLILDQRDPGPVKWKQLCTFLDKPIMNLPFPHAFNHQDWYMDGQGEGGTGHAGMQLGRTEGMSG